MAGYFIVAFEGAHNTTKTLRISSIDGYKGTVHVDFSVLPAPPKLSVQTPASTVYVHVDEDEFELVDVTVAGTAGTTGTLSALAADSTSSDAANIQVTV